MQPAVLTPSAEPSGLPLPTAGTLLRPWGLEVESLDFDQFQRFAIAARLLDHLLNGVSGPVQILEVSSHSFNLLPLFLDPARVHVTRCGSALLGDDQNMVVVQPGQRLPFTDESFDAVLGLEVLEHMPSDKRPAFLVDCLRVARQGAIFSCPNGVPQVVEAEKLAAAAFHQRHGRPHPDFQEHRTFGLPCAADVVTLLRDLDHPFAVFDHAPLESWLAMTVVSETLSERRATRLQQRVNQSWAAPAGTLGSIPYRKFFACAKMFDANLVLEPLPDFACGGQATLVGPPVGITEASLANVAHRNPPNPPFVRGGEPTASAPYEGGVGGVSGSLNQMAAVVYQTLTAVEEAHREELREQQQQQGDLKALLATRTTELRRQCLQVAIINSLLTCITRSRLWRLLGPLRAIRRALLPRGFDARALIPWQQLERVPGKPPGTWLSQGRDPQFIVPCLLPAGWLRIRIKMSTESRGRLEIYADSGQGFSTEERLGSCAVGKVMDRDYYVRLGRPIRAVRIDPLNGPGEFRVESLQFEPLSRLHVLQRAVAAKYRLLREHGLTLRALGNGLGMLLRGRFGQCLEKLDQALDGPVFPAAGLDCIPNTYEDWRRRRRLTNADLEQMRAEVADMQAPPRISVIMPVYNVPERYLRLAIDSVLRQTYPHWELCIADDQSSEPHVRPVLEEYAGRDQRVRVTFREQRGNIAAASNSALALATGEYIALLDHDDEVAEHALFKMAQAIVADRGLAMLYSDEDKLDLEGRHVEPFFKPDWSPEYFLSYMYTTHLGVYRTALVRDLGGFRSEYDTAQDYDLALRVVARSQRIKHIPDILYHWRKLPTSTASGQHAKPLAHQVACRAAQSYLTAIGRPGTVEPGPLTGLLRVRPTIAGRPTVSIVIPSACRLIQDQEEKGYYLSRCIDSIVQKSSYRNYEIIVVHNNDMPPALAARLNVVQVAYTAPFNLSAKINLGASVARGEQLVLMNDDMEIITAEWLESMLEFAQQPEIGAVGCKLFYPDGRLQHVGVILYNGEPGHCFHQFPGEHTGYFCGNSVIRNYSAVTGACLMTRAEVFHSVGGFDESFPLNYNDIDYCLKVVTSGKRIVYTPYAALYHYESVSKTGCYPHERDAFLARWRDRWRQDPHYNPNLCTRHVDYRIDVDEPLESEDR